MLSAVRTTAYSVYCSRRQAKKLKSGWRTTVMQPFASTLRLELRRDFLADLGPPFFHRLEPVAVAAIGLGLAEELVLGLVEVDLEAQGLRHVPRRVAEHLDAVAFGVLEIDGPGIAVTDRADALAAGVADLAERLLHIGQRR